MRKIPLTEKRANPFVVSCSNNCRVVILTCVKGLFVMTFIVNSIYLYQGARNETHT